MECSEVRQKLDEYMKNRLDCDTNCSVEEHLKDCLSCSEELNLLRELNDLLDMESTACPASDFTERVMGRIDRELVSRKRYIFDKLPVLNLGASLVLAGLLTIFVNTSFINNTIISWKNSVSYGAAAINSGISTTTRDVGTYISNILNPGGK